MALTYSPQIISGLSTDTKPMNVPDGMMFLETDTAQISWRFSNGWRNVLTVGKTAPGSVTIYAGCFTRVCDTLELGVGESVTLQAAAQLRID